MLSGIIFMFLKWLLHYSLTKEGVLYCEQQTRNYRMKNQSRFFPTISSGDKYKYIKGMPSLVMWEEHKKIQLKERDVTESVLRKFW